MPVTSSDTQCSTCSRVLTSRNEIVPSWATSGFRVTVNGSAVSGTPVAGSYFAVSRNWRSGDVVKVAIPFRARVEKALDDSGLQTLFYGPVNLVARNSGTSYLQFGLFRNAALSGDLLPSLSPVSGKPLHYTLNGTEFAPFSEGTEDPTHAYFRRSEPKDGHACSRLAFPPSVDGALPSIVNTREVRARRARCRPRCGPRARTGARSSGTRGRGRPRTLGLRARGAGARACTRFGER